jgi:HemK-like putative methylase
MESRRSREEALKVASRNFLRHGASSRIEVRQGDLWAAVPPDRRYRVLFVNLPYIPARVIPTLELEVLAEPRIALDGGEEGLSLVRRFIEGLTAHVAPGAVVGLEVGWDQTETVADFLRGAGAPSVKIGRDVQGHGRWVLGEFSQEGIVRAGSSHNTLGSAHDNG